MTTQFALSPMTAHTKGAVKRLRLTGFVPVSLQHKGMTTLHFQQETRPISEYLLLHGEGTLLDLVIAPENNMQRVMIQSVERDGVSHALTQVTYTQIRHDDTLKTHVPLVFIDSPTNSELILQHRLDQLEIECDQSNLPDHITVSLANMHLGDVVRVSDLPANSHYKILTPADSVLASLTSNRTGSTGDAPVADAPAA